MFIILKIKYMNGEFSSIGKIQRLNQEDKEWYIDFILESMKFKSEYYNETQINSIIFSYGFKKGSAPKKTSFFETPNQSYKNYNLPISLNQMNYGRLINQSTIENGTLYILQNELRQTITFKKFEKYNEVEFFNKGIRLVKFIDEIVSENKFIRIIDNNKFYFVNNKEVLFTKELKSKFISKLSINKSLTNNFLTFDFETYIKDNVLIPFCVSYYDGKKTKSFYLENYPSTEAMILDCLSSLLIRKYNRYKIYVHNLARFDVIFLLKYLVKISLIKPIIHEGRIISIVVNFGPENKYQFEFKDSYLLLLASLNNLSKSFKIESPKSNFPYLFVEENNLDYEGPVPQFKYFDNQITLAKYNEYKSNFNNNNWNLKEESIKYCENDVIALYQIIEKFSNLIFSMFNRNIHHYPTLPSLAFGIFRSNFMKENTIPQLSGKIAKDIRSGYTGGSVEVYIPKSKPGVKIKAYDVNALYPNEMKENFMPIGTPIYFEGNIFKIKDNPFGFFYCKITAPDNIKHPILQTHVNTNAGIRTISPIGIWEDMLFSEEILNALKYGYKIEVLWGYLFEKEIIFKEYVEFLHNFRLQYPKSDPKNFIAKILLNSLYGRFGMDDNFANISVIHENYYPDFENKFHDNIIEVINLDDYKIIFYENINEEGVEDQQSHNVSIGIAACITAYARIHMSNFKNNKNINLYYSDTDSIFTDSELDESLIDSKVLGKLKLENICNKAIFLTPKVYCLKTIDGNLITKVKGLTQNVKLTMEDFENLLIKNSLLEKTQTKWFRKLSEAKIELLNEIYTLKVNDNKRQLIYNKNNKLIGTNAYRIDFSKDIRNKH